MLYFQVGQQVKLATMAEVVFTITMINPDGTYVIEAVLSQDQTLTYSNVSQEMLRLAANQCISKSIFKPIFGHLVLKLGGKSLELSIKIKKYDGFLNI